MIKGFQDQKSSRTWVFFVERYDSNIIENESILVTFLTISFNQKACVENVDFSKIPNSKIIERWSYDEANTLPQRFVGRHVSNVPSVVFSCGFRWCHSGEVFLFPFRHGIPDRLVTSNGPGQLSWRRFFSKRDPSPKPVETCGMTSWQATLHCRETYFTTEPWSLELESIKRELSYQTRQQWKFFQTTMKKKLHKCSSMETPCKRV